MYAAYLNGTMSCAHTLYNHSVYMHVYAIKCTRTIVSMQGTHKYMYMYILMHYMSIVAYPDSSTQFDKVLYVPSIGVAMLLTQLGLGAKFLLNTMEEGA